MAAAAATLVRGLQLLGLVMTQQTFAQAAQAHKLEPLANPLLGALAHQVAQNLQTRKLLPAQKLAAAETLVLPLLGLLRQVTPVLQLQ